MKLKIEVNDFGHTSTDTVTKEGTVPGDKITKMSVSYDGGRFVIYVNGVEFFKDMGCSHDVNAEITVIP
jgi:hypothetical protein